MTEHLGQGQWAEFLAEFSKRNRERRARFELFDRQGAHEEKEEAVLESILLRAQGEDDPDIIIRRTDRSESVESHISETISAVRRINPQYDTDGSESALEFEDGHGKLTILRFESKVDGAS